jgi:hypothetical protein
MQPDTASIREFRGDGIDCLATCTGLKVRLCGVYTQMGTLLLHCSAAFASDILEISLNSAAREGRCEARCFLRCISRGG